MKRIFFKILIMLFILISSHAIYANNEKCLDITNYEILPGVNIGPITNKTSEDDLINIFGEKNVKSSIIYSVDYSSPGTTICEGTQNELQILWRSKRRESPSDIFITRKGAKWHTVEDITIGMLLDALVRLNGRDFQIWGFFSDYSGFIKSWEGGNLQKYQGVMRLELEWKKDPRLPLESVFSSSNRVIRELNPQIIKMEFRFP